MTTTSEILRCAADEVRQHWCPYVRHSTLGVCATGALENAINLLAGFGIVNPETWNPETYPKEQWAERLCPEALFALAAAIDPAWKSVRFPHDSHIATEDTFRAHLVISLWNDMSDRTSDEVVAMMEKAAMQVESEKVLIHG